MKRVLFLILIYISFSPIGVFAQSPELYSVAGAVVDSISDPIVGVIISLKTLEDVETSTQITDKDGKFKFKVIAGKYKISVTTLSYNEYSKTVEVNRDKIIDNIILTINAHIIETVPVLGSRIKYRYDNYIVSMQNNPVIKGKNASEVLTYLPYVSSADGVYYYPKFRPLVKSKKIIIFTLKKGLENGEQA